MSERFRTRWEYEDQLLNTRTNLFLVLNGLGAVAVQLATKSQAEITIAIIFLVVNVLWIICAIQSMLSSLSGFMVCIDDLRVRAYQK